MSTLIRLRAFIVPGILAVILAFAAGWYGFFWLPSQHRYLDDRNFRVLNTLSDQIRLSINNFDKMLDNVADSGVTRPNKELKDYLSNLVPQLEPSEKGDSKPVVGDDYGDPPKIAITSDDGTHYLYMALRRDVAGGTAKYAVKTDLEKLIGKLLPQENPFHIVLVARRSGEVVFQKSTTGGLQKSPPGIELARIDMLEDAAAAKAGKPDVVKMESLLQSSRFAQVTLAGALYRLYAQPLQLSFLAADPNPKADKKNAAPAAPEEWVVCGLVRADAFRSESQSIRYTYILWFSVSILLALAIRPFLRLHTSSPSERFRAREVVSIALFTCLAAAVLTFILLDLYYWPHYFVSQANQQMKSLATAIDQNFQNEENAIFAQLDDFARQDPNNNNSLLAALLKVNTEQKEQPQLKKGGTGCDPPRSCRVNILADQADLKASERHPLLQHYPYLQYASWSDYKGIQRVKWTTYKSVTPFLNLDDPSIPHYPDIKKAILYRGGTNPSPTQGISSQYSPNTGRNITIFWKLLDVPPRDTDKAKSGVDNVFSASLVTRPISVVDAVLPEGFQFAVIQSNGTVIFHSDQTRNLRENFFAETDQDEDLRSSVAMRVDHALVTNYMGRPYRIYVHPMTSDPNELWSVVIFRDLLIEETMNLEILSLSSILFFLYSGIILLVIVFAHFARRGAPTRSWFWPDSRKALLYRRLPVFNSVAALMLLVLPLLVAVCTALVCAIVIPLGAVAANFLVLRREPDVSQLGDVEDQTASDRWQLSYVATCTALLGVVAVVPCFSFFKVACDFESNLFTRRNQLRLAEAFDARTEAVRRHYLKLLPAVSYKSMLFAGPESQPADKKPATPNTPPLFSYHAVLHTRIERQQGYEPRVPENCGWRTSQGRQRCVELFLAWSSPAFNSLADDNLHLAQTGSSDTWSWSPIVPAQTEILPDDNRSPAETGSSTSSQSPIVPDTRPQIQLIRREPDNTSRVITSRWSPLQNPWGEWVWWAGTAAFFASLFWFAYWSLRTMFLLDFVEPLPAETSSIVSEPCSFVAKLSTNLLIICPKSAPVLEDLKKCKEVQSRNIQTLVSAAYQAKAAVGGTPFVLPSSADPVDAVIQDGRPLLLCDFNGALKNSRVRDLSRLALERVLSGRGNRVILATVADPVSKSFGIEREQWDTLLQSFVRIDLPSGSVQGAEQSLKELGTAISDDAYQRWFFPRRSRSEKLVLVHLAQEKVVNPNSRSVLCQLMREGVVDRNSGLVAMKDTGFERFLQSAVPPDIIKHWENKGASARSTSLRTSLVVLGLGIAGFLYYTQGEVFNTWVTYATGLTASIPALLRVFSNLRGKSDAEA